MNLSVVYGLSLLALCGLACILLLLADRWPVPARVKLGIILVMVACGAVIGMYP